MNRNKNKNKKNCIYEHADGERTIVYNHFPQKKAYHTIQYSSSQVTWIHFHHYHNHHPSFDGLFEKSYLSFRSYYSYLILSFILFL